MRAVRERSGQRPELCYQCGTCTAGCPFNFVYDLPVGRIMRLVQLGRREEVLSSRSIWLCGSCQACTTRCPNAIDVARIMDVLRHMAREAGLATEPRVKAFGDAFLDSVARNGRVYELGVVAGYVRRTGDVFADADLAPTALMKGKLGLLPHRIKGREHVAAIFRRWREPDAEAEAANAAQAAQNGGTSE